MSTSTPPPPSASPSSPMGDHRSSVLQPGALVLDGRFRVERLLGAGGMGQVYVAEQVSLGRKVALKVLHQDMGLVPGMAERFRREARLSSQVDHPAVVRVIDFGEAAGAACLVMELVEGRSLDAALAAGPLPPERAVPLLAQLADGLAAIHAVGIVHRDLKPENVILTEGPRGTAARLLDFGIARLEDARAETKTTQAGIVLGTPEYMSPEQAMGQPLDVRSDLYAFGVLAFRALAGRLPFDGPTPRDYLLQHLSAQPRPLVDVAPAVAPFPHVVQVVMACLEKDAAARPPNAAAVLQALLGPQPPVSTSGVHAATLAPALVRTPTTPSATPVAAPAIAPTTLRAPETAATPSHADGGAPPAAIAPTTLRAPETAANGGAGPAIAPTALRAPEAAATPSHADNGAAPAAIAPTTLRAPEVASSPSHADSGAAPAAIAPTTLRAPEVPSSPSRPAGGAPWSAAVPGPSGVGAGTRPKLIALGVGLALLGVIGGMLWTSPERTARRQLRRGDAATALATLRKAAPKEPGADFSALLALALHSAGQHDDEWATLAKLQPAALSGPAEELLEPLLEDYVRYELDGTLRQVLERVAKHELRQVRRLSKSDASDLQWAATRALDKLLKEQDGLVDAYVVALESKDCWRRGVAASRLGDLGDDDAVDALETLKAQPRGKVLIFDENCGQDEAAAALQRLARKKK